MESFSVIICDSVFILEKKEFFEHHFYDLNFMMLQSHYIFTTFDVNLHKFGIILGKLYNNYYILDVYKNFVLIESKINSESF